MSATVVATQGWDESPLLDLVRIKSGQVDPREAPYRDLPLIAPDHIASETGRLIRTESAAAQEAISGKYLVRPGDVIYSKIRPYLQKAYKCDFEALCSADMYPLTPRPGVDSSFILHSILGRDFTNFAVSVSARSGIPKINRQELAEYRIRVPSELEQRAIGQALDDADEVISALERMIAKKKAIKQGMMQQLLTGLTRLPGFSGGWQPLAVASKSIMKARIGWQGLKTDEYRDSGTHRLVGGTEFVNGRVEWRMTPFVDKWRYDQDPHIQLRPGDILLTKDGSIGKTAFVDILPGPATLNSGVFVIRPLDASYEPRFLFFMLRSRAFRDFLARLSAGSTISHLYQRDLLTLVLDVPPKVDEQEAIANVLGDAENELIALQERLTKARGVKRGMMQELLTGRTRLPVSEGAA